MTLEEQRACMAPLQLAGLMIMENGGETFRVEETVTHMGRAFGLQEVESFSVPSGLFISYRLSDGTVESSVKRVYKNGTNLDQVDRVNQISRRTEREGLSCEEVMRELKALQQEKYKPGMVILGAAVCSAGFTLMFGGGVADTLISFVLAGMIQFLSMLPEKINLRSVLLTLPASVLTALIPMLLGLVLPWMKTDAVVAGALMPMLPGLMMTNAIQDTMRGDMVSGLSHGSQAVLTAALVAGGALIAETFFRYITGGGMG